MERSAEFGEKIEEKVTRTERSRLKQAQENENPDTESGYSEAQQALDIEMRSGDLAALKKSKTFQSLKGNIKRLIAYRAISIRLRDLLIVYVGLIGVNPHRAQKLLSEILSLQRVQTYLFYALIGKTTEVIDRQSLPDDIQEFLF